jgi:conjugative relaxase-like TrwC/TraI family protein
MLVINSASSSGVAYWQRSASHTFWLGQGAQVLGLYGRVDGTRLQHVLLGQAPGGGTLPERPGLRRRHGWDLVFAAPKSLSLLAAAGPEGDAAKLRGAYRQAVTDTVATLEDRAAWARRAGDLVPAQVVAGAFEHHDNDAGHPHLHAHVVLANLGLAGDGKWSCLVGDELWRWREGLGAGFQLALRGRLAEAGFDFTWAISNGGLGEITTVPAPVMAAASTRSRAVQAGARSFGSASLASGRVAQGRSRRRGPAVDRGVAVGALAQSGWGPAQATAVLGAARSGPALPPPPPAPAAVAEALARRESEFTEPDVLVALAESCPAGLGLAAAAEWARRWCDATVDAGVGGTGPPPTRSRWTTVRANHLDDRVVELAQEARSARTAKVSQVVAEVELAALGTVGRLARAASQLACSGEGVAVLPAAPWLDQAACADAARAIWQAAGMTVEVACPSELSARRWRALTSLEEPGTARNIGAAPVSRPGRRVLMVDAAGHMSPAALAQLVEQATATQTKLVLVIGGTVPGTRPSMARSLDRLTDQLDGSPLADLAGAAALAGAGTAAISLKGIVVQGSLTGAAAMAHLVAAREAAAAEMAAGEIAAGEMAGRPGRPSPLMVAFGPAEAEALNAAARARRLPTPGGTGRQQVLGERAYAVGDEVLALRRIGPIAAATRGTVWGLGEGGGTVEVEWRGPAEPGTSIPATSPPRTSLPRTSLPRTSLPRTSLVGPEHAPSLGYGYATTVPYLRGCKPGRAALLVLGDPLARAGRAAPVTAAWVTLAGPGIPAAGAAGLEARRRAGTAQLAAGWPDAAMLERAGPRPLNAVARRRWAQEVTAAAVERDLGLPARARPDRSLGPHPGRRAGPTLGM